MACDTMVPEMLQTTASLSEAEPPWEKAYLLRSARLAKTRLIERRHTKT